MQSPPRATLRDVAKKVRLSLSAVSLALRKPEALPAGTVERIRAAATEVGYVPDPALSALAAYRSRRRVKQKFAVLALVSNWPRRNEWFRNPSAQALWAGATARAQALGYTLQHHWAREGGASPQRCSEILRHRGIRGLLLAPFPDPTATFELQWEHFAVVTIERSTRYTSFHHVVPNYYADMLLSWQELGRRGYRRIGLVINTSLAERVAHQWEAALGFEQRRTGSAVIPPCMVERDEGPERLLRWLERERPDAVISRSNRAGQFFRAAGIRIPEDLGYASLNVLDDALPGVSGIRQPREIMGAAAVDALNAQLLVSQRGPGQFSVGTQVDGVWQAGTTVRPPL